MSADTGVDYVIRVHDDPCGIEAQAWDALLAAQAEPTPFMRHAFMVALHRSGSACADTGWSPAFITLEREGRLQAACAAWLKDHSYGEYVFDWAWADAFHRHGLRYYPKLLAAVPFTPVPGTRLLAADDEARAALARALREEVQARGLSSAHVLFPDDADARALQEAGWMIRQGVQFHWQQPVDDPAGSFEELLSRLHRDKRKKIQQERRRVREAGVEFSVRQGSAIGTDDWDFFHQCYTVTYRLHHSTPYLSRDFFAGMQAHMPEHWLMFIAHREGRRIGCSLIGLDPGRGVAYGRYWGAVEHIPCLHFEACYYQPLAWCVANGYRRFEGGAQGEHKMARGLLPVATRSAHWIADARFASAVDDFLRREGAHVEAYLDELREHSPFRREALRAP